MGTIRITTAEAAQLMRCRIEHVVIALRVFGLEPIRCGATFLWNKDQVEKLLQITRDSLARFNEGELKNG